MEPMLLVRMAYAILLLTFCGSHVSAAPAKESSAPPDAQKLAERDQLLQEVLVQRHVGRPAEAAKAGERVLAFERDIYGHAHVEVAERLGMLAELYTEAEDWPKAVERRKEQLQVREQTDGPKHWRTTDVRVALARTEKVAAMPSEQRRRLDEANQANRQAWAHYQAGRYLEAVSLVEQVDAVRRELLGEDDPERATSLNNLALLHVMAGAYAKALPLYERALAIHEKALGPDHPTTATNVNNLAGLYESMGAHSKALPLFERSLATTEKALGANHPSTATNLNNLASLHKAIGDHAKALPLFERALMIRERALGPHHSHTAMSLDNLAGLHHAMGAYAKAVPLYERALAIYEETLSSDHPTTAGSLNNLASLYTSRGDYAKALPLYERALAINKKTLGPEHRATAASLNNLASLHQLMGEYAKALPLFERALAINEKSLGLDHPDTATSLNNVALLRQDMGEFGKALPMYERALAIVEKALGPDHPDTAGKLNNLAHLHEVMGNYAQSLPLYQRALAINEKALGAEHPYTAMSLGNLAGLHHSMGDYAKALPLHERALAISEKSLGLDHPGTATSVNNLANLHESMGEFAKALPLQVRALAIREKTLGPDHPYTATSLNNLAGLHVLMGAYAKALPLYERALAVREKALGQDHPDTAESLNNLAFLHKAMGAHAKALRLYERALATTENALGPDHPDTTISVNNLALLHESMGDYVKALPLFERALAVREKALGSEHPSTARSLNNLALLYKSMGAYAKALPLFERALAVREKTLGQDHPETAGSLNNLAFLHKSMGGYAKAVPLYERALAINEKMLGENHPDTATGLNNLALLQVDLGHPERALTLSSRAAAIARISLESTASVQSEQQQLTLAELSRVAFNTLLSLSPAGGATPAGTYGETLAWKGAVSTRQRQMRAMRQAAGADADAETVKLFNDLESTAQRLATLQGSTPGAGAEAVASHRQKLDELSEQMERLQRELSTRSVAYRQEKARQRRTPGELAAALPIDSALVDVLEYDHYTPAAKDAPGRGTWERRLVAFVVRRDQPVVRVDLGAAQEIADLIDGWRSTFGAGDAGQQAGTELRQRLWQPLLPHLGEAKTVLVSPDGALCRLPLGALPGKEPGKYLLEEVAITIVPVPRDLPELLAPHEDGALLLVGGVDYDADPAGVPRPANPLALPTTGPGLPATRPAEPVLAMSRSAARVGDPGASRWDSLPGTKTEARALLALYAAHHAGTPQELTGAGATERAFREQAQTATYLHLATHGYFADPTVKSALTPATQPAERMLGRESTVSGWHPGLLSGIVLAGANRPADALRSDDGILTALEVSELDLQRVDLAVLSACETGLGQSAGGEGLLGLQRAFQTAGARSVVAGQWKVHDAATAVLMETFYTNLWEKKMPKGEALRQAQLALLNGGATRLKAAATARGLEFADGQQPLDGQNGRLPPYYWAGFVLSGDWR